MLTFQNAVKTAPTSQNTNGAHPLTAEAPLAEVLRQGDLDSMPLDRASVARSHRPESAAVCALHEAIDSRPGGLPNVPADQLDLVDTCPCSVLIVDGDFATCTDCGTGYDLHEVIDSRPGHVLLNALKLTWGAIEEPRGPSALPAGEA